jgi:hypothetical protein
MPDAPDEPAASRGSCVDPTEPGELDKGGGGPLGLDESRLDASICVTP